MRDKQQVISIRSCTIFNEKHGPSNLLVITQTSRTGVRHGRIDIRVISSS